MTNDQYARIIDYVEGHMSPEERRRFEYQLSEDSTLRDEVEIYKRIQAGIKRGGRGILKNQLTDIESAMSSAASPAKRQRFIKPWTLGIAASVAIVVSALLFYFFSEPGGNSVLYAEYYKPYPNIVTSIERGTAADTAGEFEAFHEYESGNYTLAKSEFDKILQKDSTNIAVKFYLAITLMEENKFSHALPLLEEIGSGTNDFTYQAQWYGALCLLRLDHEGKVKDRLEYISRQQGPYQERAGNMLKALAD